jgi:flagellar hook-length control protein FliK
VKSVNALLNSLLSAPTDATGMPQSQNPVNPKGSAPNRNNFGNVLAQVTSQNNAQGTAPQNKPAPGSTQANGTAPAAALESNAVAAPNALTENSPASFTSVSESTVAITESVKVENVNQLAQAEQALVSLATGLAQVIQMISRLQQTEPQQAQAALASLNSTSLTPSDLQAILNNLQPLVQKIPDDQNPLLLTSGQQEGLLNQMFQQMMQAQQILLGGAGANSGTGSNSSGASALGANGQSAILQLNFSNISLAETVQSNLQASQVFINLDNFKMSATFIQAGSGSTPGQASGQVPNIQVQTGTPVNSQSLINNLNQALANSSSPASPQAVPASAQTNNANAAVFQNNLNENFKAIVQLLMQSGVTQAALTTFLNNQQKGGESQNALNQSPNTVQTVSANNLTRFSPVSGEIQPVVPTALTGESTNNPDNLSSAGFATSSSNGSPLTPIQAAGLESSFGLNVKEINTLDAVVARLNVSALHPTQGSLSIGTNTVLPSSSLTLGQILGVLEATQLSSGSPVDPNGNPSVPLVTPAPLQQPSLNANVNSEVLSTLEQSQLAQPETVTPSTTTGSQTVAILSTISQEPVIQAVPPLFQPIQGEPLNNAALNNGVANLPANSNIGLSTVPVVLNPSLTGTGNNNPNSSAPNASAAINPLPQTNTLPNFGTTPLPTNQNNYTTPQAIVLGAFNQTANPAPTSQTPVVPSLALAGEAVKAQLPVQTGTNNFNNAQGAANGSQPASTIKPASPEAVSPVVSVSAVDPTLSVSDVSGKNAPNNSTVLEANALLSAVGFAGDKTHGVAAFSLTSNPSVNAGPTGSIDSAQILNQISQQVAAQTADAKTISRLNFQLVPESLGKVTVQIALVDQSVSARIIVTNPDIREVLQSHMVDLKTALNQAGLQIDQLQVQVQGGGGNLLAQYYQYQQEGSGYRLPASLMAGNSGLENTENTVNLAPLSVKTSLVNVLA